MAVTAPTAFPRSVSVRSTIGAVGPWAPVRVSWVTYTWEPARAIRVGSTRLLTQGLLKLTPTMTAPQTAPLQLMAAPRADEKKSGLIWFPCASRTTRVGAPRD